MRASLFFALLAIGAPLCAKAQGAARIAGALSSLPQYQGDAVFEVFLPQAEDPVVYNLTLQSAAPGDSLAPCRYIVRWSTVTPNGPMEGFSAYFDGNHYRYRNQRLQEYHVDANEASFRPLGVGSEDRGVQQTAQFVNLLPQFLGADITTMLSDTSYVFTFTADTVVNRKPAMVLKGVKRYAGYDSMRFTYIFDPETLLPILSEVENSPGSVSEQLVTVKYQPTDAAPVEYSEEALMETWPEVFEKYRQSTFRTENLVGARLPQFAAQKVGDTERYSHHSDEGFAAPTVIVVLDPEVETSTATVRAVRSAVDMLPMQTDVIWACKGNREEDILNILDGIRAGETALMSVGSLVRGCGVTLFPTTVFVGRDGVVKHVLPGYNKDYEESVIQLLMVDVQ